MTRRLFFALWPSPKQRRQIETAIEPHKASLTGKWTARSHWHVTLVFLGTFPDADIAALQAAAAGIQVATIRLRFDRIDYWPKPRIMCLQADQVPQALTGLVRALEKAAGEFGFRAEKRSYTPHLTIARRARFFDSIRLAQPLDLEWTSFRLVESVPTPDGVLYKPLKQRVRRVS